MLVTVRVERSSDPSGSLEAWGDLLRDPIPAVEAVAEAAENYTRAQIGQGLDAWGQPWAPRSPVTVEIHGGDNGVRRSLRSAVSRQVESSFNRVVVTLDRLSARIFSTGAPRKLMFGRAPAPQPARPLLPLRGGGEADLPNRLREEVRLAFHEGALRALRGLNRRRA